eukprot:TRINITY_DN32222_c0_g1_i6.p1 TRINITY_DN32222_c0_g1~~TRINITY_DN32222_c0_g1_i6.p1  ORF type:complete len:367 (-),score=77.94 TRINITY_DN32222_c0_g1_i6:60-1160(-)
MAGCGSGRGTLLVHAGLPKTGTTTFGKLAAALDLQATKGLHGADAFQFEFEDVIALAASTASSGGSSHADALGGTPFERLRHAGELGSSTVWLDFPFYAVVCELARHLPEAKFVLVERPAHEWARSVARQLFCQWLVKHRRCAGAAEEHAIEDVHLEEGFKTTRWYFDRFSPGLVDNMCEAWRSNPASVCPTQDSGARGDAFWVGARAAFLAPLVSVFEGHSSLVRSCVPPSQLLALQLEDPVFAFKVAQFLGCSRQQAAQAHQVWDRQNLRLGRTTASDAFASKPLSAGLLRVGDLHVIEEFIDGHEFKWLQHLAAEAISSPDVALKIQVRDHFPRSKHILRLDAIWGRLQPEAEAVARLVLARA